MTQLDQQIKHIMPRYLTNSGHGHVWERPDGTRMRCGGAGMCKICSADKAALDAAKDEIARQAKALQQQPINRIFRSDVEWFRKCRDNRHHQNNLDTYQRIATKSAIYPGKGTPFGLMYAALGLAEAGEVQNKVKKAFRDDNVLRIDDLISDDNGETFTGMIAFGKLSPERRAQIIKELGGALWYIAAVCDEINATMSEVALQNLEELCSRGERDTLRGDGDNR